MFALWDRWMDFVRRHIMLCFWLCIGYLAGMSLWMDTLGAPLWSMELLALPVNLLSWPISVIYEQGYWQERRRRGGQGIHYHHIVGRMVHLPVAVTTLAALHLLASF